MVSAATATVVQFSSKWYLSTHKSLYMLPLSLRCSPCVAFEIVQMFVSQTMAKLHPFQFQDERQTLSFPMYLSFR